MTSITSSMQSTLTQSVSTAYGSTTQVAASNLVTSTTASSQTISISGRAIMLSRLFHTADPNANPKIEYQTTTDNLTGSVYSFLNTQDRALVAKLYEYAAAKGIDPSQVDNFAFDLGHYRMFGAGGPPDNAGFVFDSQGNPSIAEFNAADEAIAQRLLTSKARNDTQVDHGFLRAILTPTRLSVHATNFNFLQEIVFAFSASGSDGSADPNAKPVIRPKKEDFPPIKLPPQGAQDGHAIMTERLFGNARDANGAPISPLASYLTDLDKEVVANRYAEARKRGEDLSKVDKFAMKLAAQRFHEKLLADFLHQGKQADKNGRTGETSATSRNSAEAGNALTPGKMRNEGQLRMPTFT